MRKVPIRYAVLRFQPYPETGEFANIGVVAVDPVKGLFTYKLAERHSKRITDFFHNLDRGFYLNTVKQIGFELEARLQAVTTFKAKAIDVLDDLTKPKSNLFQFGQAGALKAVNLDVAIEEIYNHFVGHEFARNKSYELKLRERVKHQLDTLELERPFTWYEITDDFGAKVRFELTRSKQVGNDLKKEIKLEAIIKPFGFEGDDVNKLHTHLTNEVRKLELAKDSGWLEDTNVLIPAEIRSDSEKLNNAWHAYKKKLSNYGELIKASQAERIAEFAKQ